ncbi:hypothetical protein A3753_12370 [Sulfitobacter sp. HI0082]|nr:hypothetical protein A3753_23405 [Sulfitobacter sp. HI0082]KZZ28556.1 hypothetical protein A3753_12370 [Sulfitobacter sp. HI0082]
MDCIASLLRLRDYCHITFGVQPHRAVVEIRRPNAQKTVVYDHYLGMNKQPVLFVIVRYGAIDVKAIVPVDGFQSTQQPLPVRPHDEALQDAVGDKRANDHDFWTLRLRKQPLELSAHAPSSEILRLNIDRLACRLQQIVG